MTFNVKIGINPISWMNDDLPLLGGETPLETALAEGAKIGYRGFELGNKFPKAPAVLATLLSDYQLEFVSGWYSGHLAVGSVADEISAATPHLELLIHNGAKVMIYGEVAHSIQGRAEPLYRRPQFKNISEWQHYADKLTEFAHFTLAQGVRLAYHHHMGAYVETPADIERLMTLTGDALGLLFDSGHIAFAGGNPSAVLEQHIERVCHVHCKDIRSLVVQRARNGHWSFLQSVLNGVFTVPGYGAINFEALLQRLYQYGYEGWLVVEAEQDPAVAPSYRYAQMGYRHLTHLVQSIRG